MGTISAPSKIQHRKIFGLAKLFEFGSVLSLHDFGQKWSILAFWDSRRSDSSDRYQISKFLTKWTKSVLVGSPSILNQTECSQCTQSTSKLCTYVTYALCQDNFVTILKHFVTFEKSYKISSLKLKAKILPIFQKF